MTFADWLGGQMEQRRLTVVQLASAADVSRGTVTYWRTGQAEPMPETAQRRAELFGVSVEELATMMRHPIAAQGFAERVSDRQMTFADWLCDQMRLRRVTVRQLAKAIRMAEITITFWRSGRYEPRAETTRPLAAFFEVPAEGLAAMMRRPGD